VRQFPLALSEGVVALRVRLEERQRDFLPRPNLLEGIKCELFGWNQQSIPAQVLEQRHKALAFQVEVVPPALGFESLQLEVKPIDIQEGEMPRCKVGLVRRGVSVAAHNTTRFDRLNLGVPGSNNRTDVHHFSRAPSAACQLRTTWFFCR
jgi:hypothetical protein